MTDDLAQVNSEAATICLEADVLPGIKLNPAGVTAQMLVALAYAKGNREGYAECAEAAGLLTKEETR